MGDVASAAGRRGAQAATGDASSGRTTSPNRRGNRLPRDERRALVLIGEVGHDTVTRFDGRSGSGPVPKSSRRIILKSITTNVTW